MTRALFRVRGKEEKKYTAFGSVERWKRKSKVIGIKDFKKTKNFTEAVACTEVIRQQL